MMLLPVFKTRSSLLTRRTQHGGRAQSQQERVANNCDVLRADRPPVRSASCTLLWRLFSITGEAASKSSIPLRNGAPAHETADYRQPFPPLIAHAP